MKPIAFLARPPVRAVPARRAGGRAVPETASQTGTQAEPGGESGKADVAHRVSPARKRLHLVLTVSFGAWIVFMATLQLGRGDGLSPSPAIIGSDYRTYMQAGQRWLSGGSFYPARQLAGPYELATNTEVLYPPTSIPLFAAFSVLPPILWWAVPTVVLIWAIWRHRPSPLAYLLIGIALVTPWTWTAWVAGNPVIWAVAATAIATHFGWAGPAMLVKPTLFPLALVGIGSRGWWVTMVAGLILAIAFLPLWADYFTVIRNAHGGRVGILYGLGDLSFFLIPLVAWAGTTRSRLPSRSSAES